MLGSRFCSPFGFGFGVRGSGFGIGLERAALEKEAESARHTLELATTRADRQGEVTWVFPQEGALVRRGEVVARLTDLGSFRVDATISDIRSSRIAPACR